MDELKAFKSAIVDQLKDEFDAFQNAYDKPPRERRDAMIEALEKWLSIHEPNGEACVDDAANVLRDFLVNELLRVQGKPKVCALCNIKKQGDNAPRQSHIFSLGLLRTICRSNGALDLWSVEGDHSVTPKTATLEMLCAKCENDASGSEGKFIQLYRFVNNNHQQVVKFRPGNWLLFVVAHYMFRGILANMSLFGCYSEDNAVGVHVFTAYRRLKRYLAEGPCNNIDVSRSPSILQYLLPDMPVVTMPKTSRLNRELRQPKLTSLARLNGNGVGYLLHCQFGHFYWVYDLVEEVMPRTLLKVITVSEENHEAAASHLKHFPVRIPAFGRGDFLIPPSNYRSLIFPAAFQSIALRNAQDWEKYVDGLSEERREHVAKLLDAKNKDKPDAFFAIAKTWDETVSERIEVVPEAWCAYSTTLSDENYNIQTCEIKE